MSIEKDLGRIASALEKIAAAGALLPAQPADEVPPPPAPTKTAGPPPAAVEQAEVSAPPVEMTAQDLNKILVAEVPRVGGRDPLDKILNEQFSVQSLSNLGAEHFTALIAAVKALPDA